LKPHVEVDVNKCHTVSRGPHLAER